MGWDDLLNPFATSGVDELLKNQTERIDCGELVEINGVYVPAEE